MKEKCGKCTYYQDCIDNGEEITKTTAACEEFEQTNAKKAGGNGKGIMAKNICFSGCGATVEQVFGKEPISRADVVSLISAYIRDNDLVL
jgi:hypothetical protein